MCPQMKLYQGFLARVRIVGKLRLHMYMMQTSFTKAFDCTKREITGHNALKPRYALGLFLMRRWY